MISIDRSVAAHLDDTQLSVAAALAAGTPPVHVLQGAPGTGKSFLAATLAGAFLDAGESVLVIATPLVGEQIAARAEARASHAVVRITKAEARARDLPSAAESTPIIGLINPSLIRFPPVAEQLASRRWGLTIVDLAWEATLESIEPLLARQVLDRLLILASLDTPDLTPLTTSGLRPALWSARPLASFATGVDVQFDAIPYRRADDEACLISNAQELIASAQAPLLEMGVGQLESAAASSPFALQARALRVLHRIRATRNLAVHGQLRLVEERDPPSIEHLMSIFQGLEKIVIGVDQLQHDAKLSAFIQALDTIETSPVAFFRLAETADYVAQALRLNDVPALRTEPGARNRDLAAIAKGGGVLLAVEHELVGLDLRAIAVGINYDLPSGPRDLNTRIARLSSKEPRLLTLIDDRRGSRFEERILERVPVLRGQQPRLW